MSTATPTTPAIEPIAPAAPATQARIAVDARELARFLGATKHLISRKNRLPILDCVHLASAEGGVRVEVTDLAALRSATLAGTHDGDPVAIPHADLLAAARGRTGTARIVALGAEARIEVGDLSARALTWPADEWPLIPPHGVEAVAEVPAGDLARALRLVLPAVSADPTRGPLCGVLLEARGGHLIPVASDGYALAHGAPIPGAGVDGAWLLQVRGAIQVADLAAQAAAADPAARVTLRVAGSAVAPEGGIPTQLDALAGGDRVRTVLLTDRFPRWRGFLPTGDRPLLSIAGEALGAAVRACQGADGPVTIQIGDGSVRLEGARTLTLPVAATGPAPFEVTINARFLRALTAAHKGPLALSGTGPSHAVRVEATRPDGTPVGGWVIMPITAPAGR